MLAGFTTTIQSVPITIKVISSNPVHGEVYSIQHYVIKFVNDLQQVGGFLRVLHNKTDHHDISYFNTCTSLKPLVNQLQQRINDQHMQQQNIIISESSKLSFYREFCEFGKRAS
jgi:hypothetical protein